MDSAMVLVRHVTLTAKQPGSRRLPTGGFTAYPQGVCNHPKVLKEDWRGQDSNLHSPSSTGGSLPASGTHGDQPGVLALALRVAGTVVT